MSGNKALSLLEEAKRSPYGWKRTKLDRLYLDFGFKIESKNKHDIVKHTDFPDLRATLTRSSSDLHPEYVRYAIKLILLLQARKDIK
jgi:hypothetical protein